MSFVTSIHNIDKIKSDFDEVCDFLQEMLNEINKKISIKQTKLHKYKEIINNIDDKNINIIEYFKTIQIVQRYNNVVLTIKSNIDLFDIDKSKFINIIDGTSDINDFKDKSNHLLFELEMAVRFFLSSKKNNMPSKINLSEDSDCDIIVDNVIAIECKYIESKKSIEKNIKKAISQIEKRISNNQAKFGIIALDLRNVIDIEKIDNFSNELFNHFYQIISELKNNPAMSKIIVGEVSANVILNNDFKNIVSSYFHSHLEYSFYKSINKTIQNKVNENVGIWGMIFQANHLFVLQYGDEVVPIPNRGLGYYLNERLPKEGYHIVQNLIHQLATGI